MEEKKLELDFRVEYKDYEQFNFMHNYSQNSIRILTFLIFVFLGVVIYVTIKTPTSMMTTLTILYIALVFFVPLRIRMVSRRAYYNNAAYQKPQHVTITSEGIRNTSESGNMDIGWDKVFRIRENRNIIAIYLSQVQATIIPIRTVTPEELSQLKEMIKNHVPAGKIHLRR